MISIENPTFLSLANYRIYFGFITYYNNRGVAMHPYIHHKSLSRKQIQLMMLKIHKVKNIRLVPDAADGHDIECKIDGFGAMKLKSSVVKKA